MVSSIERKASNLIVFRHLRFSQPLLGWKETRLQAEAVCFYLAIYLKADIFFKTDVVAGRLCRTSHPDLLILLPFYPLNRAHMITTASGLQYDDTITGTGAEATAGQRVSVHYTGWLFNDGVQGGKFDSSKDRGQPFQFALGGGQVIRGWDEGVQGMKVGGTRRLLIPAELGYGARGAGGVIPPNATLLFEVELLAV